MKARKTGPEAIVRQMRISAILSMRLAGHGLKEIGEAQDPPCSKQAIFKTIRKALAEMLIEPFEAIRLLEAFRLDEMLAGLYEQALNGDVSAVDRVLSIMARRARLLGLDAAPPVRFVSGDSYDVVDQRSVRIEEASGIDWQHVHRLEEKIRLLESGEPAPASTQVN
jgi:hypothetical protein